MYSDKPGSKSDSIAKRIRRDMIARSKIHYSTPALHSLPLYIGSSDSKVKGYQPVKKSKRTPKGPSTSDMKREIVKMGTDFFGARSVAIRGSESSGYKLNIVPRLSKHKSIFRATSVSADNLPQLRGLLEEAIRKVRDFTS